MNVRSKKMNRAEKKEYTYQLLMEAGMAVVGERGYAGTTIARVTEVAGVSHGSFYSYFRDRQAMFDVLLPYAGDKMIESIQSQVPQESSGIEREVQRFRAYCQFVSDNKGFYRILYEAEVFAPKAHRVHMTRLRDGYRRSFQRSAEAGSRVEHSEKELDALISILLGARAYVSMHYIDERRIPEDAISAYEKLIRYGLYRQH